MNHSMLEVFFFMYNPMTSAQPVYEADASIMHTIHQCRDRIHHVCKQHMNKRVMVNTVEGQSYEGMLAGFDDHYLYLDVSVSVGMRPPFPVPYPVNPSYGGYNPYYQQILPLVLFNLLTISLL